MAKTSASKTKVGTTHKKTKLSKSTKPHKKTASKAKHVGSKTKTVTKTKPKVGLASFEKSIDATLKVLYDLKDTKRHPHHEFHHHEIDVIIGDLKGLDNWKDSLMEHLPAGKFADLHKYIKHLKKHLKTKDVKFKPISAHLNKFVKEAMKGKWNKTSAGAISKVHKVLSCLKRNRKNLIEKSGVSEAEWKKVKKIFHSFLGHVLKGSPHVKLLLETRANEIAQEGERICELVQHHKGKGEKVHFKDLIQWGEHTLAHHKKKAAK